MINRTYFMTASTGDASHWRLTTHRSWFPEPVQVIKQLVSEIEDVGYANVMVLTFERVE